MVYPQSYTNIKYKIHGRFREISLWDFLMILTILLKTNLDPNKQLRKRRAARNKIFAAFGCGFLLSLFRSWRGLSWSEEGEDLDQVPEGRVDRGAA
jgi:hypothetical protein